MNLKGKLIANSTLTATTTIPKVINTGGASTWNEISGKPFSTVDTTGGLTIYDNTLGIDTLDTIATIDYVDQQIAEIPQPDLSDYYTKTETDEAIADAVADIDLSDYALRSEIPTDVSELNNDSGYITDSALAGYATEDYVNAVTSTIQSAVQSDWAQNTTTSLDYIKNKPAIGAGTGIQSIWEGGYTFASGDLSHAEGGDGTTASGRVAHAENSGAVASGMGSHAEGWNTIAASDYQHAQGKGNIEDNSDIYADIIGNGYPDTSVTPTEIVRSNAEATDWNGNKYLAGDVYIGVTDWSDPQNNSTKLTPGSVVGITNTLSTGTAIADIDIDGVTTTLYAPSGSGSTDWNDITNKPTFATVATSGDYDDLVNKPIIPTVPSNVSAFTNDAGYITDSALTPYVQASALTTVAYSGDYNDLDNLPTIPVQTSVTVTQTLSTGTAIADIDVNGVTTTLYAPAGGGGSSTQADWAETDSTADSYIQNKPAVYQGNDANSIIAGVTTNLQAYKGGIAFGYKTGTGSGQIWSGNQNERGGALAFGLANGYHSIKATGTGSLGFGKAGNTGDIQATGAGSLAFGDVSGSGAASFSAFGNGSFCGGYGTDLNSAATGNGAIAFGGGTNANKNFSQAFGWKTTTDSTMQMAVGKLNVVDSASKYRLIVGNGSGTTRSNAFAAGDDGNIYVKGGIYINVTDWTNPQANSTKLANIPAPPTTDGTYTLQVTVSNGTITYSWI